MVCLRPYLRRSLRAGEKANEFLKVLGFGSAAWTTFAG